MGSQVGNAVSQVGNAWNDVTGANRSADAAQSAANAQLGQQRADREAALKFAAPSPEELAQLQQAISLNSQDIARKQKILDSSDPALIESGKQALALLQGKEASTMAPLRNQRAQQRAALEQQLQQRLGPDYASSTAGIQALNSFDQQSANLMANQQQQTLAQFMGYVGMGQQAGSQQANIANSQSFADYYGKIGTRQANVITGTQIDPGLAYTGDMARASAAQRFQSQQFNEFLNPASNMAQAKQAGLQLATAALSRGGGGGGTLKPTSGGDGIVNGEGVDKYSTRGPQ